MVDTDTQYSVLNKACGPLNKERTSVVQGATGTQLCSWTTKRKVDLGKNQVTHSVLVVPESPAPLLGRDLLTKVGARIYFEPNEIIVTDWEGSPIHVLSLSLADEYRLFESRQEPGGDIAQWLKRFPTAWAETAGIGLTKHLPPVVIQLKASALPIQVKQYPMPKEA
jgi:hypothetical protein